MEAFCSARSRTARLPACMVSTWAVRIESSDLVLCGACCKDMDADVASTVFGRLGGRGRRAGRQTDRQTGRESALQRLGRPCRVCDGSRMSSAGLNTWHCDLAHLANNIDIYMAKMEKEETMSI